MNFFSTQNKTKDLTVAVNSSSSAPSSRAQKSSSETPTNFELVEISENKETAIATSVKSGKHVMGVGRGLRMLGLPSRTSTIVTRHVFRHQSLEDLSPAPVWTWKMLFGQLGIVLTSSTWAGLITSIKLHSVTLYSPVLDTATSVPAVPAYALGWVASNVKGVPDIARMPAFEGSIGTKMTIKPPKGSELGLWQNGNSVTSLSNGVFFTGGTTTFLLEIDMSFTLIDGYSGGTGGTGVSMTVGRGCSCSPDFTKWVPTGYVPCGI